MTKTKVFCNYKLDNNITLTVEIEDFLGTTDADDYTRKYLAWYILKEREILNKPFAIFLHEFEFAFE